MDLDVELDDYHKLITALATEGDGINVSMNNVTIDSFYMGLYLFSENSSITATNLVILNTALVDPGFPLDTAILSLSGSNTINWISGRSNAPIAITIVDVMGEDSDIQDAAQRITISSKALSSPDFDMTFDDPEVFQTTTCVNQFVNRGFILGTTWDICDETDGGDGDNGGGGDTDPDGGDGDGDLGNGPGTPGTGFFTKSSSGLDGSAILSTVIGGVVALGLYLKLRRAGRLISRF